MSYWFAGFFARPRLPKPEILPARACWRAIDAPFDGVGVDLPHLHGERPSVAEIEEMARDFGLAASTAWLYLTYTCWGGELDSVYGFGKSDDRGRIGPIDVGTGEQVEPAYLALMDHFGVAADDAMDFPPFRRGFWSDRQ